MGIARGAIISITIIATKVYKTALPRESVSAITVVVRRYIPRKTLAPWVNRKCACSEGSSSDAGVQGLIKYIKAKHMIGRPSERKSKSAGAELSRTILNISV
uniref:Uncharacterized protein n=1 Tax=Opuntia streptacantha TaxID=393608 RepID=A0A7C9EN70_OPUST